MATQELPQWRLRWPGVVDRTEVWQGNLVFELRGFTPEKVEWDDADVEAARAVYPGLQVVLSGGRNLMFVGDTAQEMLERIESQQD